MIECLIQRNLQYATTDVRVAYAIIKEKLYNPQFSKVVFILHSQGGIEGSLVIDWLLQELPQNLLAKLEVYTFGNASNHFNNPHRHVHSQTVALRNPLSGTTDSTKYTSATIESPPVLQHPLSSRGQGEQNQQQHPAPTFDTPSVAAESTIPALTSETSSISPSSISGRVIGHIEHYAHTSDFVALWGVLHFATSAPETHIMPRYIGRLFARTSTRGGHQFVQHYLDGMFPLEKDPVTGKFTGCLEEGNEFMESEVVVGVAGDGLEHTRDVVDATEVEVHSSSPVLQKGRLRNRFLESGSRDGDGGITQGESRALNGDGMASYTTASPTKVKVKQLSRLWEYRNGRSPEEKPPLLTVDENGVVRSATM